MNLIITVTVIIIIIAISINPDLAQQLQHRLVARGPLAGADEGAARGLGDLGGFPNPRAIPALTLWTSEGFPQT